MGNKFSISQYALETWVEQLEADFVREVASANWGDCYDVDRAHVFELSTGKFAYIRESGCSCYDYSDAYIRLFDTELEAMTEYRKQVKTNEVNHD